jgi:hypothetical protein
MPTVYLETSVICHLTDPPSTNPITRACQQLTQLWWHTRCDPSRTFISSYVSDEIESADPLRARRRLGAIQHLAKYPKSVDITNKAELLMLGGGLTVKAERAAEHIACAAFNHCEILLTWNCADIANARKFGLLRLLVDDGEYWLPELVTPFELMENSYETQWRRNPR